MSSPKRTSRKLPSKRMVLISNREPFGIRETRQGYKLEKTVGGLVSALHPLMGELHGTWIAWGPAEQEEGPSVRDLPPELHPGYDLVKVRLSRREVSNYYNEFSNRVLWPLFHSFIENCKFLPTSWLDYKRVNMKFAAASIRHSKPSDFIWVQDYHLCLVPRYIRQERSHQDIAFFCHIPWPPPDVFRVLPWKEEILKGLLGANLLGFHTRRYVHNFLRSVQEILGIQVDHRRGIIYYRGLQISVKAFPIGINWKMFEKMANTPATIAQSQRLRQQLGVGSDTVILGVDRLDYTKGIFRRLEAVGRFIEKYPRFRGQFVFIQIAVPSRTRVEEYRLMKQRIDEAVGRINGRFSEHTWIPIRYLYRSFPLEKLVPFYLLGDIALVTPLRDGMNLVAKEYVASRSTQDGILILSEFAGAADYMDEALIINPYDKEKVADALRMAMEMPLDMQVQRMDKLRAKVMKYDLDWWLNSIIHRATERPGLEGEEPVEEREPLPKFSEFWLRRRPAGKIFSAS
jgi:alpha,alpha-trehalose-phosphate synthase [UDP-forming]